MVLALFDAQVHVFCGEGFELPVPYVSVQTFQLICMFPKYNISMRRVECYFGVETNGIPDTLDVYLMVLKSF